jgi:6-phosphofructokinase 1
LASTSPTDRAKKYASACWGIFSGGSPSPFDRILATRFGVAAVDLVAAGGFGMMVALHGDSIVSVDVAHAIGHLKSVDPKGELVRAARAIGICFGD